MKNKFCKDCKSFNGKCLKKCMHPKTAIKKVDLVTGNTEIIHPLCSLCRKWTGKCGKKGKYWKPVLQKKQIICPICKSLLVFPRGDTSYCENCGWPDEDFDQK